MMETEATRVGRESAVVEIVEAWEHNKRVGGEGFTTCDRALLDRLVREGFLDSRPGDREAEAVKDYPYPDGDVIVLGPHVFVAKDGSVLNWRGENYVPQELSVSSGGTG